MSGKHDSVLCQVPQIICTDGTKINMHASLHHAAENVKLTHTRVLSLMFWGNNGPPINVTLELKLSVLTAMIHFIPCIPWSRSHFQCVSRLSRLTKMLPAAVLWETLTCQTLAMVKEHVAIESRMSILHAAPPIRNGMVARLVWPIPLSLREPAVVLRLIWTATTRIPASHWGHSSA